MFKKKNNINEYETYEKEINKTPITKASDRILFDKVTNDDAKTLYYVDEMRKGSPLVLNFEDVDVATANKVLAFIAGSVYALGGKTIKIDTKIYMFALTADFLDGTLATWLEGLK